MRGNHHLDGEAVRVWLRRRGRFAYDLARAAGISEATVSKMINGRLGVSSAVVQAFADELGVTVDHLLTGTAPRRLAAALVGAA